MSQIDLLQFGSIPFSHGELVSLMDNYKSPNDKISRLLQSEQIIQLKKGLYVNGETLRNKPLNKKLIANTLYGPSYLSLDSALSFHGIIPERVTVMQSITTKRAKIFENTIGVFIYKFAPMQYYPIGVSWFKTDENEAFLMATPEKALCDKIVYTKNLNIRSVKGLSEFLFDNLRCEEYDIAQFNTEIIQKCAETSKKRKTLALLIQLIKKR